MNFLYLCSMNSARSIIAEKVTSDRFTGRIQAYSAGVTPSGAVSREAIACLEQHNHSTADLHSKSIDLFFDQTGQQIGLEKIDFMFVVCPNAFSKLSSKSLDQCSVIDWSIQNPFDDPTSQDNIDQNFEQIYALLSARLDAIDALNLSQMPKSQLTHFFTQLGKVIPQLT